MATDKVIASVVLTKQLPDRYSITATAMLHQLTGNARPYFSVTGELRNLRRRGDNQIETCGQMHAEIAEHFPELLPLIGLHLSDDDGTPMYAAANGAYLLGFTPYKPENAPDFAAFAKLWRVTEEQARDIHGLASMDHAPADYIQTLATEQASRWAKQAATGLALLHTLSDAAE